MIFTKSDSPKYQVNLRSGTSLVRVQTIFTQDSKCLIAASGFDVKVYNIQSGECVHTLKHHSSQIVSLQENKANSLQFFSCSEDGIVVRWDHHEGTILKVYELKKTVVCFYTPYDAHSAFIVCKNKTKDHDDCCLYSVNTKLEDITKKKKLHTRMLIKEVLPKENAIAFGFQMTFVAAIYKNELKICNLETSKNVRHITGERTLTCIAAHPTDFVLATGDNHGRVLIWSNIFDCHQAVKGVYHWHPLPLADLIFSCEGQYLYSGGAESVLVKWNFFAEEKSYLPRLGAPIIQLNLSPNNALIVSGHIDNTLQIINTHNIVIQVITGLTQGHFHGVKSTNILPTGLFYNSFLKSIVLNGKPGHLQFYNVQEDKQLFNLDISKRNLVSSERESVILNTDVYRAANDDRGNWLATVEYWDDGEVSPQIWLKFWEYDLGKQTFSLNTTVILPHNKEVVSVVFRPNEGENDFPVAVTTSIDGKFKAWSLVEDSSGDRRSWICQSMGCYRDIPAGEAKFSSEGSLLAVAFGSSVTLWTLEPTLLKAVLSRDNSNDTIRQIVFGKDSFSHLLLCHDGKSVMAWNLLSLSIEWILHVDVQQIVADVVEDRIAVFTEDHTLILLRPDNPEPLYVAKNISKKRIISAIFVPVGNSKLSSVSQLYFFDEDQNLKNLTEKTEEDISVGKKNQVLVNQNLPLTPFASLQAETKVSSIKSEKPENLLGTSLISTKFDISSPTFTDPLVLCSKVLKSLLIPIKKKDV